MRGGARRTFLRGTSEQARISNHFNQPNPCAGLLFARGRGWRNQGGSSLLRYPDAKLIAEPGQSRFHGNDHGQSGSFFQQNAGGLENTVERAKLVLLTQVCLASPPPRLR